jgi:bifunctional DNA-binding transcriptional regulator/antitoxin component of YhaV-PrlF toxin-antitoxin module
MVLYAMKTYLNLRSNHQSLWFTLPIEFTRRFGLQAGDQVTWTEDEHSVRLEFPKKAEAKAMQEAAMTPSE